MDVQSQTAAVVHQDAQLLPLGTDTAIIIYIIIIFIQFCIFVIVICIIIQTNEEEIPLPSSISQ